jgi:D-glycero-D-manno-heptose 1,7-bisphosphate phosphatase
MKTVIMAGGMGTRIASVAADVPKPMIPIGGMPVLERQIINLAKSNLGDILIVTGHLGGVIREYFGTGERYGVHIAYYHEDKPLGTAGGLFKCLDELSDSFLLINGDLVFDINFDRMIAFHKDKKALATLATHPNDHPYDSGVLEVDNDDRITAWFAKEDNRPYCHNLVNSGVHILTKELLGQAKLTAVAEKVDLDRDILKPLLGAGRVYAYKTPEYIKDIGTPERFYQAERDLLSGRAAARNLGNKQRAVFLDRDGVINQAKGHIKSPNEFMLIEGAAQAIRAINQLGYLAIVVTNQPVIARGECTETELDTIHKKMETELGKEGAYLDDLFYCPHHPDKGFPGERPELKIECDCRKPKPGMLLKAAQKYNIDLSRSWMAGDTDRDIQAGINAGCKTALISAERGYSNLISFLKTNKSFLEQN